MALSACKGEILRRGLTLALHRSETIDQLLASVKAQGVPGDFMECGTWRGGLSAAARALQLRHGLGERHTVLADSFKSFPTPRASAAVDNYLKMDSAVDSRFNKDAEHGVHHVVHSLRALGLLSSKVLFVEGFFNETLCQLDDFLPSQIAVLRVDSDMFLSVLQTLCCLYDRVAVGGWLIIDDWVRASRSARPLEPHACVSRLRSGLVARGKACGDRIPRLLRPQPHDQHARVGK